MIIPAEIWSFVVLLSAVTLVPGPNVIIVVQNALQGGLSEGIKTIFGNLTALLAMAAVAAFGLGSLFLIYPQSLTVLRLLGSAYLLYVAWNLSRSALKSLGDSVTVSLDAGIAGKRNSYRDGLLISFSNPKAIIFLMSVFPQYIDPSQSRFGQFVALFGALIAVVFAIHFGFASLGAQLRRTGRMKAVLIATKLVAAVLLAVFSIATWKSIFF